MLADEIIVISDGRVLQAGSCRDVYRRPASVAVGRLLGMENLFEGAPPANIALRSTEDGAVEVPSESWPSTLVTGVTPGTRLLWHVAPEDVLVRPQDAVTSETGVALGPGRVTDIIDLGRTTEVVLEFAGGRELRARAPGLGDLTLGLRCQIETTADAVTVWPQIN